MKIVVSAIALAGMLVLGIGSASAASPGYCDSVARSYANKNAGGNALGGAVVGGIGGAVLGGILGGNKGAGTGAIIGGAGGAVVGGSSWQKFYNQAYYQCINQPAVYKPQPAYAPQCPPPEYVVPQSWYQQCSYKYKSFQTGGQWAGNYKGFDGCWHACKLP